MKQVTEREIELRDGTVIPYGLCIWSTGVGPTPFTLSLPFAKTVVGEAGEGAGRAGMGGWVSSAAAVG